MVSQSNDNLEIVICDNASTDGTEKICQEYVLRDNRIRFYRNDPNFGAALNYNRTFALSTGKYF